MRQFLDRMDKPRVDDIRGIPPAIAIEQSNPVKTSRSTVGTMTEINDYLKLLWPRIAQAFCPSCGREIRPETAKSIADEIFRDCADKKVLITFWVSVPAKTEPQKFFEFLQQQGYLRVWIDNEVVRVDDDSAKIKRLGARIQVIQDRIAITKENRPRLVEALETALRFGKGKANIVDLEKRVEHPFSTGWHCAHCDLDIRPPSPGLFSFNSPLGACPECRGFGRTITIDLNKAIPDRSLSIKQGAVRVFRGQEFGESQKDLLRACAREEIDINIPFEELPKADQQFVIEGEKSVVAARERGERYNDDDYDNERWYGVRGFFRWAESQVYKMHMRVLLSRYRSYTTCPKCDGGRFQPEALNYRISETGNRKPESRHKASEARDDKLSVTRYPQSEIDLTLPAFQALPIGKACDVLNSLGIAANDS